jgi:hypothetical protein
VRSYLHFTKLLLYLEVTIFSFMQELNIRLFEGAYASNLKMEQHITWLATVLVLLQLGLLVFLSVGEGFAYGFLGIYLLHMLGFSYLVGKVWLDRHPEYSRHLTLNNRSITYRTGFLEKQHEFDWDEVDEVYLNPDSVMFVLKNDECHVVPFSMLQGPEAFRKARQDVRLLVQQKKINLTESQK